MYKIKSVQGGKIIIGDLNLQLTYGQEIDLDNLFTRDRIESSAHLRCAIDKELVLVLHKDVYVNAGIDPAILLGLEERIKQQITQQLATKQNTAHPSTDVDALLKKLSDVISNVGSVKHSDADESHSELDADKQVDIHARAVERLRKNAEGHVESKEETKDSDVASRADELEGLL